MWLAQRSPGRALPHVLLLFPLPWLSLDLEVFFRAAGGNMANGFFNGLLAKQQQRFPRSTTILLLEVVLPSRRTSGGSSAGSRTSCRPRRSISSSRVVRYIHSSTFERRTSRRSSGLVRKILAGLLVLVLVLVLVLLLTTSGNNRQANVPSGTPLCERLGASTAMGSCANRDRMMRQKPVISKCKWWLTQQCTTPAHAARGTRHAARGVASPGSA